MSRARFLVTVIAMGLAALLMIPAITFAQHVVRVVRPLDGATVRETVNILVDKSSVPEGGFASYSIDGRFRIASSEKSSDGNYYVYRWDTKALDPDVSAPMSVRQPRDGRHTIDVQVFDKSGKRVGQSKTITVYVKNSASSDMPASGLRLAYRYIPNTSSKYKFSDSIKIMSIQGDTSYANKDSSIIWGKEGTVKRTVEDMVRSNAAMIRQRLTGDLYNLQGGQPIVDYSITPKSSYRIENDLGVLEDIINSSTPGTIVYIDMLKLTSRRVKIGDSWVTKQRMLRNPVSEESAVFDTTSTLEGLEWEGGFPCAKIKTTFSGDVKVPGVDFIKDEVPVTGETISYFAYRTGKLVRLTTTATATATIPSSAVSSLISNVGQRTTMPGMPTMPGMMPGPMGSMPGVIGGGGVPSPMGTMPGVIGGGGVPSPMGTMPGMMPGMPGSMTTMPTMPGMTQSSTPQEVDVKFQFTHSLRLVR